MPLITPLAKGSSPEVDELARFFDETLGFTPNSVLTMQRRPAIAQAFITLNKAVMANEGRLTSEQKRLIGLLASSVAGCRYCQAHTTLAAQRYGASQQRLDAIWDYPTSPVFTQAEKAAFDFAVAAASVPNAVTDAIAAELKRHWDEGEIVEMLGSSPCSATSTDGTTAWRRRSKRCRWRSRSAPPASGPGHPASTASDQQVIRSSQTACLSGCDTSASLVRSSRVCASTIFRPWT